MKFNVPQFIDIEDKIAFQLTAKQLGWFALGGVFIFFAFYFFEKGYFIFWSLIIAGICSAFAFFRPAGLSLVGFIKYGFLHIVRPKIFVWRVDYEKKDQIELGGPGKNKNNLKITDKKRQPDDLDKIINLMDSQGL